MSLAEAHAALGVSEGSQFDLVSAKNRALADAKGDGERLAKVRLSRSGRTPSDPRALLSVLGARVV